MALVYKHIRKDTNEVFYIGIGKTEKRAYSNANRNKHWHNIVNKYGYIVEIIKTNLTKEDAIQIEIDLIKNYGRRDLKEGTLVNLTNGGDGIASASVEVVEKILKSRSWYKHSNESKQKMSDAKKGKANGRLGVTLSAETKQKMSISTKKTMTEAHRKILSNAAKGKTLSTETKIKISNSLQGVLLGGKNPASVKCIDLQTKKIYLCIKDLANELNISYKKANYMVNHSKKNKRYKKL
jgi:hypothetical protein